MEEIFYGEWYIKVSQKESALSHRFRIIGSDNADGTYMGTIGLVLNRVSGNGWKLVIEWIDGSFSGWQVSKINKSVNYTVNDGLIKILSTDDIFSLPQYDLVRGFFVQDLEITCKSLDPDLNPLYPPATPFDFSISREMFKPNDDKEDCDNHYRKND